MSSNKKDSKKKDENVADDGLVEIVFDIKDLQLTGQSNMVFGIKCERESKKMIGRTLPEIKKALKDAGKCD